MENTAQVFQGLEPCHFGPEPVYKVWSKPDGNLKAPMRPSSSPEQWHPERKQVLLDWGSHREAEMRRPSLWCMD